MSFAKSAPACVLGSGIMGSGIAQVLSVSGFPVRLFDADRGRAERALSNITLQLAHSTAKGKLNEESREAALERLSIVPTLQAACEGCSVVIEAVVEDMAIKAALFRQVTPFVPSTALIGSNTSSLSITELGQSTGLADRLVGLHFFNPPTVMELLEVVRGEESSQETVALALDFALAVGKTAILVRDSPGFATSRLGVALGAEAIRMLESAVASVVDIDRAMELGYRHPMGPLKLTDLVGLDVRLAILEHLHSKLGETFRPPALLRKLVEAGKLGKKSGEGFYIWQDGVAKGPAKMEGR